MVQRYAEKDFPADLRMTKTQQVMTRLHANIEFGRRVSFGNSDRREQPENRGLFRKVVLDVADWMDMGRPETITVTIEPGDTIDPDQLSLEA